MGVILILLQSPQIVLVKAGITPTVPLCPSTLKFFEVEDFSETIGFASNLVFISSKIRV